VLHSSWMQSSAEDRHAVPFGQLSASLEIGPVKVILHLRADIRFCLYFTQLLSDLCENPYRMYEYAYNGFVAVVSLVITGVGNFSYGCK